MQFCKPVIPRLHTPYPFSSICDVYFLCRKLWTFNVAFIFFWTKYGLFCFFLTGASLYRQYCIAAGSDHDMQSPITIDFAMLTKQTPVGRGRMGGQSSGAGGAPFFFAMMNLCITFNVVQHNALILRTVSSPLFHNFLRSPARFRSRSSATTAYFPHSLTSHIRILPGRVGASPGSFQIPGTSPVGRGSG